VSINLLIELHFRAITERHLPYMDGITHCHLPQWRSKALMGPGSAVNAYFHYCCAWRCVTRYRDADNVSISLATQRATRSRNGNTALKRALSCEGSCPRSRGFGAWDSRQRPPPHQLVSLDNIISFLIGVWDEAPNSFDPF